MRNQVEILNPLREYEDLKFFVILEITEKSRSQLDREPHLILILEIEVRSIALATFYQTPWKNSFSDKIPFLSKSEIKDYGKLPRNLLEINL